VPFFGAFEEQYSEYGPRMQRKRTFTAPERRRQFYALQAPSPASDNSLNGAVPGDELGPSVSQQD